MEILWTELSAGIPNSHEFVVMVIRLSAAALLGAAIGIERELAGKAAGLRTHVLVTTGTTVFLLGCLGAGMSSTSDAISRVMQGIITGIGFIGAGSILKRQTTGRNIQGVTTSAGIWMAAAIGITIGLGRLGLGVIATILTLVVLRLTFWFENRLRRERKNPDSSATIANPDASS